MSRLLAYIVKNALRNKVRTGLTLLGLMVAIGIFAFLASVESTMANTIDQVSQSTLLVMAQKDQW